MVTRHEFLARLHHLLAPKLYMETGVHTGESLKLASCRAIGIDPYPQVKTVPMNSTVVAMTSDDYFAQLEDDALPFPLDLGFIDGMHQVEFAWRDFINMENLATPRGVIVFDDVLPYTQYMTSRAQVQGDWTGDVWKVYYLLKEYRPNLTLMLVDTAPTGTLVVWDLEPGYELDDFLTIPWDDWTQNLDVPDEILFRTIAVPADVAIERLKEERW